MARLRDGEEVDVAAEAPPVESSADEIDQVRQAFNIVQRTAIEAAVDEATLRRGVSDVFRNLARRSQVLLHRQLRLLDGMERRASEPDELEDLFRIDHLTTRMRRHAEGLIILSGESPGRTWRHPVPLMDVLRAAVAEVEDYTRIRVESRDQGRAGRPGGRRRHPPDRRAGRERDGLLARRTPRCGSRATSWAAGSRSRSRTAASASPRSGWPRSTRNLASPPVFDLSGSDRLGLFIAGRLARAARHHDHAAAVRLRRHHRHRDHPAEAGGRARIPTSSVPPSGPTGAACRRRPARRADRPSTAWRMLADPRELAAADDAASGRRGRA